MTENDFIRFEWETFPEEHVTIVALGARLDDFKAQPKIIDGKPMAYYKERTVKDCRKLNGRIFLHLGHVQDSVITDLATIFDNVMASQKEQKVEGCFFYHNGRIIQAIKKRKESGR